MYDNYPQVSPGNNCRQDYEAEAKHLKIKIDTFKDMKKSMDGFIDNNQLHWLDSIDDRRTFLAIYGGLSIEIPKMNKQYKSILKKMEKKK